MKGHYLVLPINNSAECRKIMLHGEMGAYSLDVRLDRLNPEYYSYVPVNFLGEFRVEPEDGGYSIAEALPDDTYREPLRPLFHFTAAQGWNNDPNGLIYYEGRYHLFFQHNPAGNQWGNMHWGHAVSEDLLHWKELDIALYPDETGAMFSGSSIEDTHNVTGLKENAHNPLILFYTAAGNPVKQCMAYSTDGGNTFKKYAGNPILPNIISDNRDPKVIWCDETDCYILALYLDGNTYALFRSDNLIQWREFQRIELPGDSECPDFYPLMLGAERYWVLSGASDKYYIGKFENGKFVPVQPVLSMHDEGCKLYAAQTFSGISGRRIRISWDTGNLAAENKMRWGCGMSVPADMQLMRDENGYIRLCAVPVPELEKLCCSADTAAAFVIEAELKLNRGAVLKIYGNEIQFMPPAEVAYPYETGVRIYVDRLSVEVYFGCGEYYTSRACMRKPEATPLEVIGGSCTVRRVAGMEDVHI